MMKTLPACLPHDRLSGNLCLPDLPIWRALEYQINYTLPWVLKAALKNIVVTVSDQVERNRNMTWESQKVLGSKLGKN